MAGDIFVAFTGVFHILRGVECMNFIILDPGETPHQLLIACLPKQNIDNFICINSKHSVKLSSPMVTYGYLITTVHSITQKNGLLLVKQIDKFSILTGFRTSRNGGHL